MSDPNDNSIDRDSIDRQLRDAFTPPPERHFAELALAVSTPRWRSRPSPWLLAFAAAAALTIVAFVALRTPRGPEGHDAAELGALWVAAYDHAIDSGFAAGSCCDQGHDLAEACRQFCGQRLNFGGGDSVSLLGCYGGLSTGGCLGLMMQQDGDPVCVFVVPRAKDPGLSLPAGEQLAVSRRELGPLVLYALAHQRSDRVLDGFSLPQP